MDSTAKILLELLLMFAGGKFVAEILERLRQPAVVGEIIAGVLLGPSLLSLVHPSDLTQGLAEIGAIFLLFTSAWRPSRAMSCRWAGRPRWWPCSA